MKMIKCLGLVLFASVFMISCASTEVQQTPTIGSDAIVATQNKQLAKVPVDGFAVNSSNVPSQKWDSWAKIAAPVVKGIIDNLPQGYVLQITGHTDSTGTEDASTGFIGNKSLSDQRAQSVLNSLKKQGITSSKLVAKGVGSSESLDGVKAEDDSQRRVSFKVVKAN